MRQCRWWSWTLSSEQVCRNISPPPSFYGISGRDIFRKILPPWLAVSWGETFTRARSLLSWLNIQGTPSPSLSWSHQVLVLPITIHNISELFLNCLWWLHCHSQNINNQSELRHFLLTQYASEIIINYMPIFCILAYYPSKFVFQPFETTIHTVYITHRR